MCQIWWLCWMIRIGRMPAVKSEIECPLDNDTMHWEIRVTRSQTYNWQQRTNSSSNSQLFGTKGRFEMAVKHWCVGTPCHLCCKLPLPERHWIVRLPLSPPSTWLRCSGKQIEAGVLEEGFHSIQNTFTNTKGEIHTSTQTDAAWDIVFDRYLSWHAFSQIYKSQKLSQNLGQLL